MRRADVFDLFARERARFAARFPHVAAARLVLVDAYHLPGGSAWRDVAQASGDGTVRLVQRALRLPRRNLVALVRHELAHVARMDLSERATDALAVRVTGVAIRYDRRGMQTVGRGGPRPKGLHQ